LPETTPKPMLPVAGVPFLTHLLARARDAGIDHIVLSTSYKAEVFHEHFGDGSGHGIELEYVQETVPLGTGGGIRNVVSSLRAQPHEPVVIFNGDVLSGHDVAGQIKAHVDADAAVTLYLTEVDDPRRFGIVPIDGDGRVLDFLEKSEQPVTNLINAGCYVFRRDVIACWRCEKGRRTPPRLIYAERVGRRPRQLPDHPQSPGHTPPSSSR